MMTIFLLLALLLLLSPSPTSSSLSFTLQGQPSILQWTSPSSQIRLTTSPNPNTKHPNSLFLQIFNSLKNKWSPFLVLSPSKDRISLLRPLQTTAPLSLSSSLSIRHTQQPSLVYSEDFNTFKDPNSDNWLWNSDISAISSCGGGADRFLGGPGQFSDAEATAEVPMALFPHKEALVKARVHFFDNWNGEAVFLKIDGKLVWTKTHFHCKKIFSSLCRGLSVCGSPNFPEELSHVVEVRVPHNGESMKISFGSTLAIPASEASWGIDDVEVYVL